MNLNFFDTIVRYFQFQTAKFIGGLWLFYLIFQKLDVSSYALYGITQSFTMVCSLLIGCNVQASFQKTYSKKRLTKSINLVVLLILIGSVLLFSTLYWLFVRIGLYNQVFGHSGSSPSVLLLYAYIISFSVIGIVVPLLNAQRKTIAYGFTTAIPVYITIICILQFGLNDIDRLLRFLFFANISTLLVIALFNMRVFLVYNYSLRQSLKIFGYICSYTWLSLPTLGSRYIIDLSARSLLLGAKGDIAVALLTFSTSLFAVFRSVEQGFFRAVTPFFMVKGADREQHQRITKKLLAGQSIFTLAVFLSSPFWIGFLQGIFGDKPAEVFAPQVLVLMAVMVTISYYKNFYLSLAKANRELLTKFFKISIAANLVILGCIYNIELSVINFLMVQIVCMATHLIIVRGVATR